MGNFTIILLVGVLFFLFIYSISPIGAGIAGLVLLLAFLKELVVQWRDEN